MWGRVVEIMTAVWLAASPWVFRSGSSALMWCDLLIALTICVFSGLSYWRPTQYAHLLILPLTIGLVVWGRIDGTPPATVHQNHIVVGLFLLMIALIPNDASSPPESWCESPS